MILKPDIIVREFGLEGEAAEAVVAAYHAGIATALGELLAPQEAAQYLGVTVGTLRTWRKRGQGPPAIEVAPGCWRYEGNNLKRKETP